MIPELRHPGRWCIALAVAVPVLFAHHWVWEGVVASCEFGYFLGRWASGKVGQS